MKPYFRAEMRSVFRTRHIVLLVGVSLVGIFTSLIMPRMPQPIYDFFVNMFQVSGWTNIVLFCDFEGIFQAVFWVGLFDILCIYIVPSEEGQLPLLLSKPITRMEYFLAKLVPELGVLVGFGAVLSLANYVTVRALNGPFDAAPFVASCAVLVLLAVCLLAIMNFVFLFLGETYNAVLIGFLVWMGFMFPRSLYMVRPETYAKCPVVKDILCFNANSFWFWDRMPLIAACTVPLFLFISLGFVWAASRRLAYMDI